MNNILRTLLLIVAGAALAGCQSGGSGDVRLMKDLMSEDSAITMSRSMKGYELYSWKTGDDWKFVIVEGSNSLKSYDEIIAQPFVVTGVDGLLNQLKALARGEEVFWNLKKIKGFSTPPDETVTKVTEYCKKRGISLDVINC